MITREQADKILDLMREYDFIAFDWIDSGKVIGNELDLEACIKYLELVSYIDTLIEKENE